MARKPQELKSYTADELLAFSGRLEALALLLKQLHELMAEKNVKEVYATYPRRVRDTLDGARSMESSFSRSYDALLAGKPLKESSVSPRSVRRTKAVKADVKEQVAKGRKK